MWWWAGLWIDYKSVICNFSHNICSKAVFNYASNEILNSSTDKFVMTMYIIIPEAKYFSLSKKGLKKYHVSQLSRSYIKFIFIVQTESQPEGNRVTKGRNFTKKRYSYKMKCKLKLYSSLLRRKVDVRLQLLESKSVPKVMANYILRWIPNEKKNDTHSPGDEGKNELHIYNKLSLIILRNHGIKKKKHLGIYIWKDIHVYIIYFLFV